MARRIAARRVAAHRVIAGTERSPLETQAMWEPSEEGQSAQAEDPKAPGDANKAPGPCYRGASGFPLSAVGPP
jgi:hypothetical protein